MRGLLMAWRTGLTAGVGLLAISATVQAAEAGSSGVHYTLLPESRFIDRCLICGRPEIPLPLTGSFRLRLMRVDPLYSTYAVESLALQASTAGIGPYSIQGTGTLQVGGEVVVAQTWRLQGVIKDSSGVTLGHFTNTPGPLERLWPMVKVELEQTNGTLTRQFVLQLAAAPFRDLWFSTAHSLTAGIWNGPTNAVSAGDVLSVFGRVVKPNSELTARLGMMPVVPDLGLDALDVQGGGALAFSIEQDIMSESLGPLHHGDLLSSTGRVLRTYAELIRSFTPQPPAPDAGLDAVQVMENGEIWFSIESSFFSERLGRTLRRGDLLSSAGTVIRTNESLVAAFQPLDPKQDYGLDAFYVWPSGETWFSVETGFYGQHFDGYQRGDLLSDRGYVVYRALDLVAAFQPLEDLADFGLDALCILTDLTPNPPATTPLPMRARPSGTSVILSVPGGTGFYQFEKAPSVEGPWLPVGPVLTQPQAVDAGGLTNGSSGFYRCWQR
jgi:hypothetical protein